MAAPEITINGKKIKGLPTDSNVNVEIGRFGTNIALVTIPMFVTNDMAVEIINQLRNEPIRIDCEIEPH